MNGFAWRRCASAMMRGLQVPVSLSAKYGCFFNSPVAVAESDATLDSCVLAGAETSYSSALANGAVWSLPSSLSSQASSTDQKR